MTNPRTQAYLALTLPIQETNDFFFQKLVRNNLLPILLVILVSVLFPCLDKYSRTVQGLSDPILLTTQTYSSSCLLPLNVTAGDAFSYNSFIGQEPNQVFAMGLCIPGSETKDCFDCITEGVTELIQSCPNQTEANSLPGRHQHTLHGSLGKPFFGEPCRV